MVGKLESLASAVAGDLVEPTRPAAVNPGFFSPPARIETRNSAINIQPAPGEGVQVGAIPDLELALAAANDRIDRLEQALAALLSD